MAGRGIMTFVDPLDRSQVLVRDGDSLVSPSGRRFPVVRGIPRFVESRDRGQAQTADSFGYKWTRQPAWGARESDDVIWGMWRGMFGFGPETLRELMTGKTVLDAGCGSGVALRLFAPWPEAIAAVDISEAIDACQQQLSGRGPITFVQADLNELPFPDASFDVVWSSGVLHHTPDTFAALRAVARHARVGGRVAFYVYVKKAPIREFVDDHIRGEISGLPPEQAWRRMEALTALGRSLAAITQPLVIDADVPELEIKAGTYDLQRFTYYNLFKCFWNDSLSFDENVNVNFDWYHPAYAHRQTPEQVRGWLSELHLDAEFFNIGESGITVIARRTA
jgi:SAM-dependent methyltransferase